MQSSATDSSLYNQLTDAILKLVSTIPETNEIVSVHPEMRATNITRTASFKAATVSGALAIPPGPLGMLTIIPDLLVVWKTQAQMVVDIAAAYNKKANLSREVMIYCLFKHAASQAVRDLAVRVGERYLIKRTSL